MKVSALARCRHSVCTAVLAAWLLAMGANASADTLVENVNGYSPDGKGGFTRFNALMIDDHGRVKQLLKSKDKREYAHFRSDGGGRTLLPGFIDSHAHVMALGWQGLRLDLSQAHALAEMQAQLRAYAAGHVRPRWIIGTGLNLTMQSAGKWPGAAEIDMIVADRPVWIVSADGETGIANSLALREAGITKTSKAPQGGGIERLADGRPSGVLTGTAMAMLTSRLPADNPVESEEALTRALQKLASLGVTTVSDAGTGIADWLLFRRFGDEGRLPLRIYAMADGIGTLEQVVPLRPTPWLYDDHLIMRAVMIRTDGTVSAHAAWLKTPYADAPASSGIRQIDDVRLRNWISRALMAGIQPVLNANGDAAISQALGAYEEMLNTYGKKRRLRIDGALIVDPQDFARIKDMDVQVTLQPGMISSDASALSIRLGPQRMAAALPWRQLVDQGTRPALGSGTPELPASPFGAIAAAATTPTVPGNPAPAPLTVAEAVRAYTLDAAKAAFAEDRIGSLEPGKWADFILVDRDVMTADPAAVAQAQVMETWVAGKRVYVRGQAQGAQTGR